MPAASVPNRKGPEPRFGIVAVLAAGAQADAATTGGEGGEGRSGNELCAGDSFCSHSRGGTALTCIAGEAGERFPQLSSATTR